VHLQREPENPVTRRRTSPQYIPPRSELAARLVGLRFAKEQKWAVSEQDTETSEAPVAPFLP